MKLFGVLILAALLAFVLSAVWHHGYQSGYADRGDDNAITPYQDESE